MRNFRQILHFYAWTLLILLLGYGLGTFVLRAEEAEAMGYELGK